MKVLLMYVTRFEFTLGEKNPGFEDVTEEGKEYREAILAFIHVEEEDESYDVPGREKKLVNHLKWALRKNNCSRVILHSFAHLAGSKASVAFTRLVFDMAEQRLRNGGIEVFRTPFGHFLNLRIEAPGYSLARIWADL